MNSVPSELLYSGRSPSRPDRENSCSLLVWCSAAGPLDSSLTVVQQEERSGVAALSSGNTASNTTNTIATHSPAGNIVLKKER